MRNRLVTAMKAPFTLEGIVTGVVWYLIPVAAGPVVASVANLRLDVPTLSFVGLSVGLSLLFITVMLVIYNRWARPAVLQEDASSRMAFPPMSSPGRGRPNPRLSPPHLHTGQIEEQSKNDRDARVFVDVAPAYLAGFFEQHTNALATRLVEPFLDKWLKVSGSVYEVGAFSGGSAMLSFEYSETSPWVFMFFSDKKVATERLPVLQRGNRVTVIGKIRSVSRNRVTLSDCELVDNGTER
jgi:hypothetical protein